MRKLGLLFGAVLIAAVAMAQYNITGKIKDEKDVGIANATVLLTGKGKKITSKADEKGEYNFTNVANGSYDVQVSAVGFVGDIDNALVNGNDVAIDFTLSLASNQMQTVEVVGSAAKKYNSDYSFSATKTATLNKDVPQSINTITKELITDRQAFQLADAVKIVSGVVPSSWYNQYNIRGISQNEEGQIINGMRTRQYYFIQPITSNVERVEVLKGPASGTFSSVDPGGSVNMVTKKPLAINRKEISFSAGSFSTLRGTIDFTGPLNEDKTLLYRINAAYQEAKSFRDLVRNNAFLISPSISYIPNAKTSVNVEAQLSQYNGNLDRGQPIFGAVAGVTDLNSTPISLNLGASNDFFKSKEVTLTATLSHKFSNHISFNTTYMKQTWTEDLQEHRTTNAFMVDTANKPVNSLAAMQFVQRKQFWNIDNVNSYLNFDFKTGQVKQKLLVGYDLHSWEKTIGGGQNSARGFLLTNGNVANTFVLANVSQYQLQTINGAVIPRPNVTPFNLSNPSYTVRNVNDYNTNNRLALPAALTTTNSIYMQEQLTWKKLTVLLGLRQEWFKDITNYKAINETSFTNNKLLPRIGATYAVTKNINVYATYLEGFQPQSNTVTLMPQTGNFFNTAKSAAIFAPLLSDLKELGTKASLLKDKLQVTASVYEINQKNLLLNANVPAVPDSLVTRGAERSRGFEIDVTGYIQANWQVYASYSYNDARILIDNNPALVNARKQNTPYNSANLWTRYNFTNVPALKDLGIALGLQHVGNRVPWFTRDFIVPSYTTMDMAFYFKPSKTNMQLALNVNNIFNTTYWTGAQNYLRLFPGAPRNVMLTATYKF